MDGIIRFIRMLIKYFRVLLVIFDTRIKEKKNGQVEMHHTFIVKRDITIFLNTY